MKTHNDCVCLQSKANVKRFSMFSTGMLRSRQNDQNVQNNGDGDGSGGVCVCGGVQVNSTVRQTLKEIFNLHRRK